MEGETRRDEDTIWAPAAEGTEAVTDGILDGGHYDSELAPEDLERRTLVGVS